MAVARVFVDGLTLYYGVRNTPYRWLGLQTLSERVLSNDDVQEVRYYAPQEGDSERAERQATYFRALRALEPRVTVIPVDPDDPVGRLGEDLLEWAPVGLGAISLVISDHSGLSSPISTCWPTHQHLVGVASPSRKLHPHLLDAAGFPKKIGAGMFADAVLPNHAGEDESGPIIRPPSW